MKKHLAFITSLALLGAMAVPAINVNAGSINLTKIFKEDFINNSIGHPANLPELTADETAELLADEDGTIETTTVNEDGSVIAVTTTLGDEAEGYIAKKVSTTTNADGVVTEYAVVNFDKNYVGYTDTFYVIDGDYTKISSADYVYKYVAEDDAVVLTDIEAIVNEASVSAPESEETFTLESNVAIGDMIKSAEVHMTAFDENNEPIALISEIDDVASNKISTQDVVIDYSSVEIDIFAMDVDFDNNFLNSRDYRYFPTATDRSKMMLYNGKGSATEDGMIQVEAFDYDETLTQTGHYLVIFDTLEKMRNSNNYTENYISRTSLDEPEETTEAPTEEVTEEPTEEVTEPTEEPTEENPSPCDGWGWYDWGWNYWNWNPWNCGRYDWNRWNNWNNWNHGWNSWDWGNVYVVVWYY